MSNTAWWIGCAVVLLAAAALRLPLLELRPMHHDEGVNGMFTRTLWLEGKYRYDPANFHGPSLYYLVLPLVRLFGLEAGTLRLEPVLFGLLTVLLMLALRPALGRVGALGAAALLAVSPGAVFVSRYYIHEALVACFTLGIVVAFVNRGTLGLWAATLLATASAAMLFTTKETANFTIAVLLIAQYLTLVYRERRGLADGPAETRVALRDVALPITAAVLFAAIFTAFFSSFFTHWRGVLDGLVASSVWSQTGTESAGHAKPFLTYVEWLLRIEPAVLLPGLAGVVLALLRAERHATVFLALWACGMLSAYSIIPYKTPWLALNIIVPLAACAGYAAQAAWHRWSAAVWYCTCALALGISVALCVSLNFYRYDDHEMPYVYVHAPRGLHDMLKAIDRYGEAQGSGRNTRIAVVSPENWPLPWYLRNHPYASFPGKLSFDDNPRVLIARADQVAAIRARPDKWRELGVCALRPGVQLHVFVR